MGKSVSNKTRIEKMILSNMDNDRTRKAILDRLKKGQSVKQISKGIGVSASMGKKLIKEARQSILDVRVQEIEKKFKCDVILEHQFHPVRKWRFDIYIDKLKTAVEIEGGVYVYGGHNRPKGFLDNMDKYNEAQIMGIKLLRCTWDEIEDGSIINLLDRTAKGKPKTAWEKKK